LEVLPRDLIPIARVFGLIGISFIIAGYILSLFIPGIVFLRIVGYIHILLGVYLLSKILDDRRLYHRCILYALSLSIATVIAYFSTLAFVKAILPRLALYTRGAATVSLLEIRSILLEYIVWIIIAYMLFLVGMISIYYVYKPIGARLENPLFKETAILYLLAGILTPFIIGIPILVVAMLVEIAAWSKLGRKTKTLKDIIKLYQGENIEETPFEYKVH